MIRVLIVGTGNMAHDHAKAYAAMDDVTIVGGVDPNAANLAAFAAEFGILHRFSSVEDAIVWGEFDAASNVTPDAIHHRTTLPLLKAGKHVLCEKPLATSYPDAAELAQAAKDADVINMVNLTYRNVPALMQAAQMVREGQIGEVRHFEASYLQSWLTQDAWGDWQTEDAWLWRLSTDHGSMGVLGDVGVHILDFASFAAGADPDRISCRLKTFDKAAGGKIGNYTLDANDSMAMHLSLSNGAVGVIHASRFASGHINDLRLRLFGTTGGLDVRFERWKSSLSICVGDDLHNGDWVEVPPSPVVPNFRRFIEAVKTGQPAMPDFARGAVLQRVLDLAVASDAAGACDQAV
ncbi:Gfo/Idh/MocA family protein [Loktanella sp. Alg231-35]|uniref:Gfo/Idh/MocA family protein n=1 Tax=Loktanella sp. Alg231-35 TaxID=1922220 RepID=UPI000D553517|nr:Gfo/Idh/MocA family oxidoreductase [Loktanella sp. Alg231-35]